MLGLIFFPMLGLWWWVLTLGFFGWLVFCEESDQPLGGLGVLALYVVVASLLGDFGAVLKWIAHISWLYIVVGVPLYLIIGFCWGVFRYWWEQNLRVAKYNERKVEFLRSKGIRTAMTNTEIPDEHLDAWASVIGLDGYFGDEFRKFFQQQKKRVINWMSWWWLSMLSFFLKDFVLRFYSIVLNKTRVIFEGIDRRVWGKVDGDYARMQARLNERKVAQEEENQRRPGSRNR